MSSNVLAGLSGHAAAGRVEGVWRPVHFDATDDGRFRALGELLESGAVHFVHDSVDDQLRELLAGRGPREKWSPEALERAVARHLAGQDPRRYGEWVFYPWSGRLVHVLPREEYREVRTDRNRHKITRAEQEVLRTRRIGVIGLSVGNMAAVTMALEGIGGVFRLADFDRLSLTNLNRLRAGIHDVGVEKTVLAAREIMEIDPWTDIELFTRGVHTDNIDDFLTRGGPVDVLVEECDDLPLKLLVRERARAHGIPVVMDTSDSGMLDVERFDREPDRPILHGLVGDLRAEDLRDLPPKEKLPFLLALIGAERMSTRGLASLPEVGQTIGNWPQLASDVTLGGAIAADVIRRLLLGEHTESGRYYVDVSALVADGEGELRATVEPAGTPELVPEARGTPRLPPRPERPGTSSDGGAPERMAPDAVRWIAAHANLAPSGHNSQPWQLVWREGGQLLECRHDRDPARTLPMLDFESGATWLAFGALIENIQLAAGSLGAEARVETWPDAADPDLVATVRLSPRPGQAGPADPLFAQVSARVTNRRREARAPLAPEPAAALADVCAAAGTRLRLLDTNGQLEEIGALIGAGDRISMLDPAVHRDLTHGYRWSPEDVRSRPYGLDVATLDLDPGELAGLRLTQQPRVLEFLERVDGGRGLEDLSKEFVATACAVGLISVPGTGRQSFLRGGHAVQRMWLTATAHGLGVQPLTGLPYLFARLDRGSGVGLTPETRARLEPLRERYRRLFEGTPEEADVLLFRLVHAGPPTGRSLRRPLDEVLSWA